VQENRRKFFLCFREDPGVRVAAAGAARRISNYDGIYGNFDRRAFECL
jgi:hypothetical protein